MNLRRCQSQQIIHLGLLDPVDYSGAYNTYLTAYGNEALARKAQSCAAQRYADWKIAQNGR